MKQVKATKPIGNRNKSRKNTRNTVNHKLIKKNKNLIFTIIGVVIITVLIIGADTHPYYGYPSSIQTQAYNKVTSSDLLPDGQSGVFFLSWIGCPIGATDSWAIYSSINATTDIHNEVVLHSADPTDIYSNGTVGQPGLLFKGNFTFTSSGHTFTFYPLYMYNETMTGTVNNQTINGSLVSYGLSLVDHTYPSSVAHLFNKYAKYITYDNHLTTTFIITGQNGTYIYNSFMYTPLGNGILGTGPSATQWTPHSPEYTMNNLSSGIEMQKASATFTQYLRDVK